MSLSPKALNAAYKACIEEALEQSPFLISRWFSKLSEALSARCSASNGTYEKRQVYAALVELKKHQSAIEKGFPAELRIAIAAEAQGGLVSKIDKKARTLSTLRFDELELMGEDQVQETLADAKLQQALVLAADAGLADFSARLSTALGFSVVRTDKNPLRPELISQVLQNVLQDLPVQGADRSRWLLYGAQLMGEELQALYVELASMLAQQGIPLAAYVVISAREEPAKRTNESVRARGGQFEYAQAPSVARAPESFLQPEVPEVQAARRSPEPQSSSQLASAAEVPIFAPQAPRAIRAEATVVATPPSASAAPISREKLLTLDHLHSLMSGDFDDSFKAYPGAGSAVGGVNASKSLFGAVESRHTGFAHTVTPAMRVLTELEQEKLRNNTSHEARPLPPQPVALVREKLKTDAKSMGQSLAIEVVGLMMEQLIADKRLLAPVRQILANSEPAFLRLAVTDPRFFSHKNHPARMLLDAITTKSLAYATEKSPGFDAFMQDVNGVAAMLDDDQPCDADHFAAVLHAFENQQLAEAQSIQETQNEAVQTLLLAEQRHLLAEKIAVEISLRSDYFNDNAIIAAFLLGPWAQVMAKERINGERGGLGRRKAVYALILGDILWSLDLAQSSRNNKRLLRIIPDMINLVRDGLLTIDYPLAQSKDFFNELMRIHQIALSSQPEQPKTRAELEKVFYSKLRPQDEAQPTQPWLASAEVRQSGFMDFEDGDAPAPEAPLGALEASADMAAPACDSAEQVDMVQAAEDLQELSSLRLGAWVELYADTAWVRAQLTWISPHNTLFMFSSEGGRSHSMTSRMLQQLLAQKRITIISIEGLLDDALDTVARTAMRNSVDVHFVV